MATVRINEAGNLAYSGLVERFVSRVEVGAS